MMVGGKGRDEERMRGQSPDDRNVIPECGDAQLMLRVKGISWKGCVDDRTMVGGMQGQSPDDHNVNSRGCRDAQLMVCGRGMLWEGRVDDRTITGKTMILRDMH